MYCLLRHPHLAAQEHKWSSLLCQFPLRLIMTVNAGYLMATLMAEVAPLAIYVLLMMTLVALIARIIKFELGEGIKP